MSEPDNIVLEHVRAIRAELADVKQRVVAVSKKRDSKAEAAQVADVERKLDGLTHVVISSIGARVRSFEALDRRVSRLEREPV